MNTVNLNELLYLEPGTLNVTTTGMAKFIKVFEEKFGADVPLSIDLSYKDMKFTFGVDTDLELQVDFKLQMRVMDVSGKNGNGYFYDEIPMQVGMNL
jgi:hypothetical protein